jgi:SAM-dependent methyltransferase
VNIDSYPNPGVDLVIDLDAEPRLPYADDSVAHSEGSHVIEHLHRPLPMMEELWRVTKPGGTVTFHCPYGSSDDADEDPTHVRRLFVHSWGYFGQPYYWRADYGYRGDWAVDRVVLKLNPEVAGLSDAQIPAVIRTQRNVVREMTATLHAVKPAREPKLELQQGFNIVAERPPEPAVES